MTTVALGLAWSWTCPACGQLNFVMPVAVPFDDENAKAEGVEGAWLTAPKRVMCRRVECMAEFGTEETT